MTKFSTKTRLRVLEYTKTKISEINTKILNSKYVILTFKYEFYKELFRILDLKSRNLYSAIK